MEKEDKLKCKLPEAQAIMEGRLASNTKASLCDKCGRKTVAKV